MTSLPPGIEETELEQLLIESNAAVACTQSLLTALITGAIVLPEIKHHEIPVLSAVAAAEQDLETQKLQQRLGQANEILRKKRSRIH